MATWFLEIIAGSSIAEKQKCENEAFALRLRLAYRVWRFKCTAYRAVLATAGKSYTLQSVLYWYSIHTYCTTTQSSMRYATYGVLLVWFQAVHLTVGIRLCMEMRMRCVCA